MTTSILHLSLPVRDLEEARRFYVDTLGLEMGRVRESWFDVWFYGMQVSLQLAQDTETTDSTGIRHFGVALPNAAEFDDFVAAAESRGIEWLSPPTAYDDPEFNGKVAAFVSDPSGNVIEFKTYGTGSTWMRA